ncbi:hypothetical protein B0H15DRAFT_1010764 [Mycena belliarum]|uniref:Uncharacterized protein n=1 Tax=Mycena belliarum TaxID=1033014 RepID=A0AAD6TP17_9AGAR|nr:hypothetical protein B0H15DRAFT_1010764 [Mycena belliae]
MARSTRKTRTTSLRLVSTPQDQCLRNSDLFEQILHQMWVPTDGAAHRASQLKAFRRSLLAAALTCRDFSLSAVKLIWRSLDNLLPLLRLLPSFTFVEDDGVYNLGGIIADSDWTVFDRFAAYVRDIVYVKSRREVNPLAYVRLAMRSSRVLLPNLSQFECSCGDPPGAEIILCIAPALVSVTLRSSSTSSTSAFLDMFAPNSPALSHLTISNQPRSVFSVCSAFRTLKSIELRQIQGPGAGCDSALVAIGSLPSLQSLTTDFSGWDHDKMDAAGSDDLFGALTCLNIAATSSRLHRRIPLFLPKISSPALRSHQYREIGVIACCIATRWPTALKHLSLSGISCTQDDFASMEGITGLRTLNLDNILQGPLSDARVLAIVGAWSVLTAASLEGAEADIAFFRCVAQHCGALRTLRVGNKLKNSLTGS